MKYRSDIDGLRAIAVIPVIFFHAGFEFLGGGFIGVDIFFVISGYLITMKIIEDLDDNKFCLFNFYERRARRILPALFTVTIVCLPLAWILLDHSNLNKFGNSLIGISLFVSNIVFWKEQGYFSDYSELNPLIHTWSLSVEEQYYLFFPLLLLFFWRFGKRIIAAILFLLVIASILSSELVSRYDSSANFYLLPTRVWEILIGSICAFRIRKYGIKNNEILSIIGILVILLSYFIYTPLTPFPSLYTILPISGVLMLVFFCGPKTSIYAILSAKPIVGLGLISYSAYLWHQPVFAFYRIYSGETDLSPTSALILIIMVLILSVTSWKYVEQPFRGNNCITSKKILYISITMLTSIAGMGYFSKIVTKNYEFSLATSLESKSHIYFTNMNERKFIKGRLRGNLSNADVVCVGSSRLMQMNSTMIDGKLFNFSVSGASIEDIFAISLESVAKVKPKSIYIGLDPWIVNRNNNQERYKSISDIYEYWFNELGSENTNIEPYLSNLKGSISRSSLETFLSKIHTVLSQSSNTSTPPNGKQEAIAKKSYDGSHIYDSKYSNLGNDIIYEQFNDWISYGMNDFVYDQRTELILLKLLRYLTSIDLNVSLVLSPYHPEFYKKIQKEQYKIIQIEEKYRNLAKDVNVTVLGSYDPSRFNLSAEEFYDGIHPKESAMAKILPIN